MTVSPKVRSQVFERDCKCCVACGTSYGLTIQHRINRGMGGSKRLDGYANLLTLCFACNTALESDAAFAEKGRDMGWKVHRNRGIDPADIPVFYHGDSRQWLLDDDGERRLD